MSHRVVFAPEAEDQLVALYRHIAEAASPDIAARYTEAIVRACESLSTFPQRGRRRDDVRPGLRITSYRRRVAIAFMVQEEQVLILGIYAGGQNYETLLRPEPDTADAPD